MKKIIVVLFFFLGAGNLVAAELYWYLAASMTKPGKEIVRMYNGLGRDQVYLIIGGSGQILNKLIASGKGDIYTPASEAFMKKAEQHGIVKQKRLLLEQTPVFGLSKNGAKNIKSFEELIHSDCQFGVGNPKTMALGNTFLKISKKMEPSVAELIKKKTVIKAINISQIVNYLKTGTIEAGTIFDSVARANKMSYIEIPDRYNIKVKAFFIKLTTGHSSQQVDAFENYVYNSNAIFNKYGFQLKK